MNADTPAAPKTIASELMASGSKIQLESVKAHYGELAIKAAWKLLQPQERDRIKTLCDNGQREEVSPPVTEQPEHRDASEISTTYPENVAKVDTWLQQQGLVETQPTSKRSLFNISDDLEKGCGQNQLVGVRSTYTKIWQCLEGLVTSSRQGMVDYTDVINEISSLLFKAITEAGTQFAFKN